MTNPLEIEELLKIILYEIHGKDILPASQINKMAVQICSNKDFWERKFASDNLPMLRQRDTPSAWIDEYNIMCKLKICLAEMKGSRMLIAETGPGIISVCQQLYGHNYSTGEEWFFSNINKHEKEINFYIIKYNSRYRDYALRLDSYTIDGKRSGFAINPISGEKIYAIVLGILASNSLIISSDLKMEVVSSVSLQEIRRQILETKIRSINWP